MLLKRFHDPKLAQTSYLLGCHTSKEALVIDPNRDIDRYLQAAEEEGLRISHVTETHIHADFVSGARELAHRTGARLYLSGAGGSDWSYTYAAAEHATLLQADSCFSVGAVELRALHVPGHTPEHLAFLVTDTQSASAPIGVFTGDFLFVGDVGRPDLLERAVQVAGTMETEARRLFQSLQRFRALPDFLQIWPGHGAGSACGKSLSAVPHSTIGYETRSNWAFALADEAEFVRAVLAGQPDPPRYFARMKRLNQSGPPLLGGARPAALSSATLKSVLDQGGIVVDARSARDFARGAIPGTINIPATRTFTTWAGSLLPYQEDFYLIVDERRAGLVDELARDLTGVGLERLTGYFGSDVVDAWSGSRGKLQTIPELTLVQVVGQLRVQAGGETVLDVRGAGEWEAGHIPGSRNIPIGELDQRLDEVPRDGPVIVHCHTGARAAMAASMLRARGFHEVRLFPGGFAEWQQAGQPVESA